MPQKKKENKKESQIRRPYFSKTDASPAPVNYHGLMNQGATCYLNSVLQVLFMTRDFREAVERFVTKSMSGNPDPEHIDCQLKDLFDDLKERQTYTYNITRKLGIDKVNEQRDAVEYFEKILALTSDEASQIFHGELRHKRKCSTCGTEESSDGKFWHLPLELVKSNNETYRVVDGIEEYFRELSFSGENQMYCEKCDDKSDATTKYALKDPPEVLTLLLKRFEFDYYRMSYIKNNCVVDVPFTLHIPESRTYELYAVVDHYGDLRSGHYTATVKSQEDEGWYEFDDTRVTLHDLEPFHADNPNKSSSAYLIFYRIKDTHTEDMRGDSLPAAGNSVEISRKRKKTVEMGKEHHENMSDVDDQGVRAKKLEIEERKIPDDGDEEEGDIGAGEQAGKRGAFTETHPEESREDQDRRLPGEDSVRLNKPQEALEAEVTHNEQRAEQEVVSMQVGQEYPPQINVSMQRDEEIKVKQEDKDKTGESEQTEKKRKTLRKTSNRGEKDEVNEGVDISDVKQEVREEFVSPHVSVNKKRGEEEIEINKKDDKRGKSRTERPTSGRGESMMRSDHRQEADNQGEHSASKDDQGCKQRSSSSRSHKTHESQEEEGRRRRKGDEGQMERKAGNDQPLQKSESGRRDTDQENVADVRSNRSEQNDSVKSLSLEKRTGDTHHGQTREDTSFRKVRGGSGRLTEHQRDDSVERTRAEGVQSKVRAEDGTVAEGEERERTTEIETVEKKSEKKQENIGGGKERKSGPRAEGGVGLPEGFDNISLSPPAEEQRSRKTEHPEEKKKTTGCNPFCKKRKNVGKGSDDISQGKNKPSFFSLFRRKKKNQVKVSEESENKTKKKNANQDSKSE